MWFSAEDGCVQIVYKIYILLFSDEVYQFKQLKKWLANYVAKFKCYKYLKNIAEAEIKKIICVAMYNIGYT